MAIRLPAGDQLPPFLSRLGAEAPLPSACWRQADGSWVVALANRREEKALVELGADSVGRPPGKPERENPGWLELVSMRQVPLPDPWNVPTLILLADAKEAAVVARNIVSLGNDRARLGCLAGESGRWWVIHGNSLPVFVLVGQVFNRSGTVMVDRTGKGAWFPAGCRHPMESSVHPREGGWVLCHADRPWESVEAPFLEPIERKTTFEIGTVVPLKAGGWDEPIRVSLRLEPRGDPAAPSAWWHAGENLVELRRWVARLPPQELSSYMFMVVMDPEPGVFFRWRRSAGKSRTEPPPMSVELSELGGIDGVYLPCDRRIEPSLSPLMLRQALGSTMGTANVLLPNSGGGFRVLVLPDEQGDFRLLDHWVRYSLESDATVVNAWKDQHSFRFDALVNEALAAQSPPIPPTLRDESIVEPPPTPKPARSRSRKSVAPSATREAAPDIPVAAGVALNPDSVVEATGQGPREAEIRREALVARFWEIEGGLFCGERLSLMSRLADIETETGNHHEAARLLAILVWHEDKRQDLERLFSAEMSSIGNMSAPGLDAYAPSGEPGRHWAVWARGAKTPAITGRVADFLRQAARTERWPFTHLWWAANGASMACGGDTLLLAEVRDRLVRRLGEDLRLHGDMPRMLTDKVGRSGIAGHEDQLSMVGFMVSGLLAECEASFPRSGRGADACHALLVLGQAAQSIGLALLGDLSSTAVMDRAVERDTGRNHSKASALSRTVSHLLAAYRYRLEQARSGGLSGPLPPDLEPSGQGREAGEIRYIYRKFLEISRFLEPEQRVSPFEPFTRAGPDCLARLRAAPDQSQLTQAFDECLATLSEGRLPAHQWSAVALAALERAVILDEGRAGAALALLGDNRFAGNKSDEIQYERWLLLAAATRLSCHWNIPLGGLLGRIVEEISRQMAGGRQVWVIAFLGKVARRMLACGRAADLGEISEAIRKGADSSRSGLAVEAHLEAVAIASGRRRSDGFWDRIKDPDFSRPPSDLPSRDGTVGLLDSLINLRTMVDRETGATLADPIRALLRSLMSEPVTPLGTLFPGCVDGGLRGIESLASLPLGGGVAGRDCWIMDEMESSLRARVFSEFAEAKKSGETP